MSTLVPNCTITYPKDLSRLYLTINAIEFPNLFNVGLGDITLTIIKDGVATNINNTIFTSYIIPNSLLTGTVDTTGMSNLISGSGTLFQSESLAPGDVIQTNSASIPYFVIDSIVSETELISNSIIGSTEGGISQLVIRPVVEITADLIFPGETILKDGYYEIYFSYDFGGINPVINQRAFSTYVYANQYNCVEAKLMNLALYCSEDCVDMNTLKHTLLLKALLDSMEVILSEDVVDTTALGIVKEKIDRYCLLLNNNCTSC